MEREYFSIHGYSPQRLDIDEGTGWRRELLCSEHVRGLAGRTGSVGTSRGRQHGALQRL